MCGRSGRYSREGGHHFLGEQPELPLRACGVRMVEDDTQLRYACLDICCKTVADHLGRPDQVPLLWTGRLAWPRCRRWLSGTLHVSWGHGIGVDRPRLL